MELKIAMLLVVVSVSNVFSNNTYSQVAKVSLDMRNTSLEKVMDEIESQSEFYFIFNQKQIDVDRTVSIEADNKLITDILPELFYGTKINYSIFDRKILLTTDPVNSTSLSNEPQQKKITGVVTDRQGYPLPGVTVVLPNTSVGTLTDASGSYSIEIPAESNTLVFSFVGMKKQELNISGVTTLNVVLEEEAVVTGEVVVLAYGQQVKKENLTGSVAVVSTATLADKVTPSAMNALQGAAAGVTVVQNNSYPGMVGSILIRNKSSWQGTSDPLFVIDGVISTTADFSRLNPNDIDNISILKDAASAAIYGMRAGNGVILVTTKQGSSTKLQMTYQASYTMQSPTSVTERVANAYTAAQLNNKAYRNIGATDDNPGIYTSDELEYFKTFSNDPLKDIIGNPMMMNHNLSLSGGSDKIRYYLSGSYLDQDGYTKNYNFKKYTVLAKLSGEISRNISFNLTLNMAWNKTQQPYFPFEGPVQEGIYGWCLAQALFLPNYINGIPVANVSTNMARLANGDGGFTNSESNMMKPVLQLKYQAPFVKGLAVRGIFAYDNTYDNMKRFATLPYNYQFKMTGGHNHIVSDEIDTSQGNNGLLPDPTFSNGIGGVDNRLDINTSRYHMYDIQGIIEYNREFGKHSVSALAGYQQVATGGDYLNAWGQIYVNTNYQEINGADPDVKNRQPSGNQQNLSGQASYFGRLDYNYAHKYFLGFTFRADGTYIFPPDARWGYFPAASAAWNIGEESFFEPLTEFINAFKIRASYGLTGSSATNPWQWQQSYTYLPNINYLLNGSAATGITLGSVVNPEITWEKNNNFDIGADISILNGLGTLSLDYWHKKTSDILAPRTASTPNTVGATLPSVNYGEAAARGFEVTIGHQNSYGDFHYGVSANFAISSNEYLVIDQAQTVRDYQNLIGRSIDGQIWGYHCEGIIRTQADADKILAENGENFTLFGYKPQPGMLMYTDVRGPLGTETPDGRVDSYDQDILTENSVPRITYGFNIDTEWKGFALNMNFAGFGKYDGSVDPYHGMRPYALWGIWFDMWKDFWTPETPNAPMPDPTWFEWIRGNNINMMSNFWLRDRSFLRLKYINLSYTIPTKVLSKAGLKGATVYLAGENLLTFSNYYLDPEQNGMRQLPVLKSFTLGAKITF